MPINLTCRFAVKCKKVFTQKLPVRTCLISGNLVFRLLKNALLVGWTLKSAL
jgi:hypothetical protein